MMKLRFAWNHAPEEDRLELLRDLAIPFPAHDPIEVAKNVLLNLTQEEWQEVLDWLSENHWLPPGS
jgi:hypothetical protein